MPARWLVAPDSFKGTHTAAQVAKAIAEGLRSEGAGATELPLADGGEGTLEVLLRAARTRPGEVRSLVVPGPLGEPVDARWGLLDDGTAVIECAQASGLGLVPLDRRDAEAASTYGTGLLIAAAAEAGARRILLTVGGSATTDGGSGALRAIGESGGLGDACITVLCDVRVRYEEAAEVFGPQKGADPAAVERLTHRLHELAGSLPRDPRGVAMTGCAGGLSGALWAAHDATLTSGIDAVLDLLGLEELLEAHDAVVTGEGRFDSQTGQGKVMAGLARRAALFGRPVHALVGSLGDPVPDASDAGLSSVRVASTLADLTAAGARLALP